MAINAKNIEIIEPKNIWVGDTNAPVSLVMFGEYENEDCAKAHEVVKTIMQKFEGNVKFNFRHFPLTQVHPRSQKAAEASVAASQDGKFWEMHDQLFSNRRNLGTISLKGHARDAGVTNKNFLPNLVDSVFGWTVRADLLEGLDRGVRTVPTFFINNDLYEGKVSVDGMSKAIEAVIPAKGKKNKAAKAA
jgi:protein-disulfide isomerase